MSMDAIPLVRLVFGVLGAIALSHLCGVARQAYLTIGKGQPVRPTMPSESHFSEFNEDCSDQLATIVDRLERWFLSFQNLGI
jgi:hypothetical protein